MSQFFTNRALAGVGRLEPSDVSPSLAARLASYPLLGLQKLLQPLLLPGDATRALLGYLSGAELSDKGAFGIPTVSGERLLNQLGIDMGPNVKGRAELRDVPGFLVELLADPLNVVNPFGALGLTRAGKLAQRAEQGLGRATMMAGRDAAAAAAEKAAAERLASRLGGRPARLGTLAEQGRQGYRAPLTLDVPFTKINEPLLPAALNEKLLGALGSTGQAIANNPFIGRTSPIGRGAGRLADAFRLHGETSRANPLSAEFSAQAEGMRTLERRGGREGLEESEAIRRERIAQNARIEQNRGLVERLSADASKIVDEGKNRILPSLEAKLAKAQMTGRGVKTAARELERAQTRILRAGITPITGFGRRDPFNSLVNIGSELQGVEEKIARKQRTMTERLAERQQNNLQTAWEKDIAEHGEGSLAGLDFSKYPELGDVATIMSGDAGLLPRTFKNTRKAITENRRLQHRLESRLKIMDVRKEVAAKTMKTLAEQNPELMQTVNRMDAVLGKSLERERAFGVPITELTDPNLSYLHRAVTQGGRALSEFIGRTAPDSIAARATREFDQVAGFTRRRTPELEGLGVAQANDIIRQDAVDQIRRKYMAQGMDAERAAQQAERQVNSLLGSGTFFDEDPAEIMLRRLSGSGIAQGNGFYIGGLLERFNVAAEAAGKDAVPLAKALHDLKIGAVGGEASILPRAEADELVKTGVDLRGQAVKEIEEQLAAVGMEGRAIPRDVFNQARKVMEVYSSPRSLRPLLDAIDHYSSAMRYWFTSAGIKIPGQNALGRAAIGGAVGAGIGGAIAGPVGAAAVGGIGAAASGLGGVLPLFPGFFVRNALTNSTMMWFAGMKPGQIVARKLEAARIEKLANAALKKGSGASAEEAKALLTVRRARDLYGGNVGTEIKTGLQEHGQAEGKISRMRDYLFRPDKTESGRRSLDMNTMIEDNDKLAMFLHYRNAEGYSELDAANKVKEYLFDYGELSRFEKENIRRKAFFWTWQRKAAPLMLREIFTNQHKVRAIARAGEDRNDLLAAHQEGRLAFPMPAILDQYRNQDGSRMFLDFDTPLSVLNVLDPEDRVGWSAYKRVGQKALSQFAPTLRVPIETSFGVDLRSGRDAGSVPMQLLRGGTPLGRVTQTVESFRRRGAERLPGLLGVSAVKVDPAKAAARDRLDRIQRMLEEEYAAGRAKQFKSYYTQDEANKDRISALLSEESRLRRMLRE